MLVITLELRKMDASTMFLNDNINDIMWCVTTCYSLGLFYLFIIRVCMCLIALFVCLI